MRVFELRRNGELLLKIQYENSAELSEPTADSLDLETIDFFYWTALVWNSPDLRNDLPSLWKKALSETLV